MVYGDGSGYGTEVQEHFRCGWATVELDANLWPIRAVYGPLPGPLQSVGRAERWTVLQAVTRCSRLREYVADLKSLVEEGQEWSQRLVQSKCKHAAI